MNKNIDFRWRLFFGFIFILIVSDVSNIAINLDGISTLELAGLLAATVIGAALSAFWAWHLGQTILVPLQDIEHAIRNRDGDIIATLPTVRVAGGEIARLASAMDDWRHEALKDRQSVELLSSNQRHSSERYRQIEGLMAEMEGLAGQCLDEVNQVAGKFDGASQSILTLADFSRSRAEAMSASACQASKNALNLSMISSQLEALVADSRVLSSDMQARAAKLGGLVQKLEEALAGDEAALKLAAQPLAALHRLSEEQAKEVKGGLLTALEQQMQMVAEINACSLNITEESERMFQTANETLSLVSFSENVSNSLVSETLQLTSRSEEMHNRFRHLLSKLCLSAQDPNGAFITWHDGLLTGHADIDRDHKILVVYLNDLHTAAHKGLGGEPVGQIVAGLAHFAKDHFLRERKQLDHLALEAETEVLKFQEAFCAKVDSLHLGIEKKGGLVTIQALAHLRKWLLDHIADMARRLAPGAAN